MNKIPATDDNEALELAAMRAVADTPAASQRGLARTLGISLGKTNFLMRALLDKGLVKSENFRRSDNKLAYLYLLTPSGVVAKARLTRDYLARKEREYAALRAEIADLRSEVEEAPRDADSLAPASDPPAPTRRGSATHLSHKKSSS